MSLRARIPRELGHRALVYGWVAVVAALIACGPGPQNGHVHLIAEAQPIPAADAPPEVQVHMDAQETLALDQPQPVTLASSRRLALLTVPSHPWTVDLPAHRDRRLQWSMAAVPTKPAETAENGAASEPPTARLTWHQGTTEQELWSGTLEAPGWTSHHLTLPSEAGALRFTSEGSEPVAWAELHVLSGAEPTAAETSSPDRHNRQPPNLILISLDTVRSDHLSTYGYERPTSPQLDRLATESYVFERSFSASTWTLPSTASMLTGLMPAQHGLRQLGQYLAPPIDTVAELLAEKGYCSVAMTDGGFAGYGAGFAQGFERYDVTPGPAWATKDVAQIVDSTWQWLDGHSARPFFLFVQTYEAHQPHTNSEGFADPFVDPAYAGRFAQRASLHPKEAADLSEADRRHLVDLYDGEIRRTDHYLGAFLDRLRQSPAWANTAIVVTSDHGEEFFEHGDIDHGFGKVFDPNVRVPFILKPPQIDGATPVGQRFTQPVSGLDIVPTLLSLAGVDIPKELPGRPLLDPRGRIDPRRAPVLIHGTNSFPDLDEERLRLEDGGISVIFDRVRQQAQWYDLENDRTLQHGNPRFDDTEAQRVGRHLQTMLAWSREGTFVARLDDAVTAIEIPVTTKVQPRGVWDGWQWLPAPDAVRRGQGAWTVELTPGRAHHLVFDLRSDAPDGGETAAQVNPLAWTLKVQRGEGRWHDIHLDNATQDPYTWHPFSGDEPPQDVLFPSASSFQPGTGELTEAARRELEALGYL